MFIGCNDTSAAPIDPCPELQADMDTKLVAFVSSMDATTCATTLTTVIALKDNSFNASTMML